MMDDGLFEGRPLGDGLRAPPLPSEMEDASYRVPETQMGGPNAFLYSNNAAAYFPRTPSTVPRQVLEPRSAPPNNNANHGNDSVVLPRAQYDELCEQARLYREMAKSLPELSLKQLHSLDGSEQVTDLWRRLADAWKTIDLTREELKQVNCIRAFLQREPHRGWISACAQFLSERNPFDAKRLCASIEKRFTDKFRTQGKVKDSAAIKGEDVKVTADTAISGAFEALASKQDGLGDVTKVVEEAEKINGDVSTTTAMSSEISPSTGKASSPDNDSELPASKRQIVFDENTTTVHSLPPSSQAAKKKAANRSSKRALKPLADRRSATEKSKRVRQQEPLENVAAPETWTFDLRDMLKEIPKAPISWCRLGQNRDNWMLNREDVPTIPKDNVLEEKDHEQTVRFADQRLPQCGAEQRDMHVAAIAKAVPEIADKSSLVTLRLFSRPAQVWRLFRCMNRDLEISVGEVLCLAILYPVVALSVLLGSAIAKKEQAEEGSERAQELEGLVTRLTEHVKDVMQNYCGMQDVDFGSQEGIEVALLEWMMRSTDTAYTQNIIKMWASMMVHVGEALQIVTQVADDGQDAFKHANTWQKWIIEKFIHTNGVSNLSHPVSQGVFGALLRDICDETKNCQHLLVFLPFILRAASAPRARRPHWKNLLEVVAVDFENQQLLRTIRVMVEQPNVSHK